ncbi:MAG: formate/nitrite transporter family protein [Bacteroidaceae bacterium]|nr:formate/nitrite transporter family protein [Bacteroidaceae bacterium]
MKKIIEICTSSIPAGLCISIGCVVNLTVGGVAGAVLFTFGLITVVHYQYKLYTGTAGFVKSWMDMGHLLLILLFNIVGCLLTALCVRNAIPNLIESSAELLAKRESVTSMQAFLRSVFCGFLMTTAVNFGRKEKWLPLLFAVPVFILSGFYHCIADAFYLFQRDLSLSIGYGYAITVLGNFIGCNLYRIEFKESKKAEKE